MLALVVALALVPHDPVPHRAPRELTCQLVPSADPSFQDRWSFVQAERFEARRTEYVYRGQLFSYYSFYQGYGVDAEGKAALSYEVRITRPDGKTYHASKDHVGWKRAVPDPGSVLLAEGVVGIVFDPVDPFGSYSAWVRVTDGVTGASAEATAEIELVEYEEGPSFADFEALQTWKGAYLTSPELERVVPALWMHCRSDGFLPGAKDQALDGFLLELFGQNDWLFAEAFDGFAKRSPAEKRGALWLLAHAPEDVEREPFVKKLSKEDAALWAELSGAVRDPMTEPLRERHDVNEVYGRYLASGCIDPLRRLVLALHEDGGVIANETVRDSASGVDVPRTLVVPKVVAKLLGGLFRSDALARSYAGALAMGDLPPGVAAALDQLLAEAPK